MCEFFAVMFTEKLGKTSPTDKALSSNSDDLRLLIWSRNISCFSCGAASRNVSFNLFSSSCKLPRVDSGEFILVEAIVGFCGGVG